MKAMGGHRFLLWGKGEGEVGERAFVPHLGAMDGPGRRIKREGEEELGETRGFKKLQKPLAHPREVPYIRRPFSRSRDRIALSRLTI
jgi:hypothetical protein